MEQVFSLAASHIVSEVVDGEAIIMNMQSGRYHSANGVAAVLWESALAGASRRQLAEALGQSFPTAAGAADDCAKYLDSLLAAGLLKADSAPSAGFAGSITFTGSYATPRLESHDDLRDLILLDPIHDVDNSGWPTRKNPAPLRPVPGREND